MADEGRPTDAKVLSGNVGVYTSVPLLRYSQRVEAGPAASSARSNSPFPKSLIVERVLVDMVALSENIYINLPIISAVNSVGNILAKVAEAIWPMKVGLQMPRCLVEMSGFTHLFLYCATPNELRRDLLPPVPD